MTKIYSYNAYGLGICSSLAFPEISEKTTFNDVIVKSSDEKSFLPNVNVESPNRLDIIHYTDNDACILLEGLPLMRIRHGNEIIINSERNIDQELLRSFILYQGMSLILHQRGFLVLHASAININGKAVAFIGESQSGKSTIASYLNKYGYELLTDEILAIKFNEKNKPVAIPSFPKIKLFKDVFDIFKNDITRQNEIHPKIGKYYNNVNNFNSKPLELKLIYVMKKAKKPHISSLNIQDSMKNLIEHSYIKIDKSENLILCAKIFKMISVKLLKRADSLDKLSDLVMLIKKDVKQEFI